jgi:hypothetical protein
VLIASLTINQVEAFARGAGVPLSGVITYSLGGTVLGTTSPEFSGIDTPFDPFTIQGRSLAIGPNTITVTYAIWYGVAYAPFSITIPVAVTS